MLKKYLPGPGYKQGGIAAIFSGNSWYEKSLLSWVMWPLSGLYQAAMSARYFLYYSGIKKTVRFPVPVLIVGNITVGGTGKTPLTIALANWLKQQGKRPGIVSRGYGGSDINSPQIVKSDSDPKRVGDEAVFMAQATGCPLVVAKRRPQAVAKLLQDYPCDIIISDDGLQHLALGRDLEIAVMDGMRRLGNGFCLPAGPLREPSQRLQTVDFIVCNGQGKPGEWSMTLIPKEIYQLKDPTQKLSIEKLKDKTVHAIAGIGNPERFFLTLQGLGLNIIPHAFPDHYRFKKQDLDFGSESIIIMTEKDGVKCRSFADNNHWALQVRAELPDLFFKKVYSRLFRS